LQLSYPHWGKGQSASREIAESERAIEAQVSKYIGNLRVLFIPVHDSAGVNSMRATIERQFIALFTENLCPLEDSSPNWLGRFSDRAAIRDSGLWNVRDVGSQHDPKFISLFDVLLKRHLQRSPATLK
jgi:hypothetical protein